MSGIDPAALEAACEAYVKAHNLAPAGSIAPLHEVLLEALEAYEAAKPSPWRPIEEAPDELRDGSKFLAMWADEPRRIVIMWWWEFGEGWTTEEGANRYPPGHSYCHGLMFRTIDPPTQDAAHEPQDARQQPAEDKSSAM